jgi:aminoglycoside phosphotransferase family enzyme/predicted kinase
MTADDPQAAVFALLSDPATHGGGEVKRIDTHAASIFLAGDRAYKVKRAVRYPVLDYSTLDKRKAACEAELEVNRTFAPDIYCRVLPITRGRDEKLALDGDGEPVEWAVEMRRFDESATLDRLDAGRIDFALADTLARVLARAHAKAPVGDAGKWPKRVEDYITQNRDELRQHPALFAPAEVDALTQASRAALTRIEPLLRARGEAGLVRRGHGDLHLGNIVLIGGKPVIFDAIEFDPLIATGDLFYDLAFLLMDLVDRGLDAAANVVLNRYLAEARREQDIEGLAALPLFLALRAAIRAKVTAAKLDVGAADQAAGEDARKYFHLARRLVAPRPPVLVAVGGLSGSGKSTLARALAPFVPPAPGAVVLRSDVERKAMFAVPETERLPPAAYTPEVTQRVYAALADKARRATAAGHSAIVDAVFADERERAEIAAAARAGGIAFHGLFLTADTGTRVARVTARPKGASDADAAVARRQESYARGTIDWTEVDASGSFEQTLAAARAALGSHASGEPARR